MRAFVAYSRPRGIYGRYIITVVLYYTYPTESVKISVVRPAFNTKEVRYSCHSCGKWATIEVVTEKKSIHTSEHRKIGQIELFRYDNVEPQDNINLYMEDTDLLFYQNTFFEVLTDGLAKRDQTYSAVDVAGVNFDARSPFLEVDVRTSPYEQAVRTSARNKFKYPNRPESLYDVIVTNWDTYIYDMGDRDIHVEEELVQQVMLGQPITVTQLYLKPVTNIQSIAGQQRLIEGELVYLPVK